MMDDGLGGCMHSSLAGDIHVSNARTVNRAMSRAMSSRSAATPWLDKTDAALLDNLDEGDENEETSLFEGKGPRVTRFANLGLAWQGGCLREERGGGTSIRIHVLCNHYIAWRASNQPLRTSDARGGGHGCTKRQGRKKESIC